ncbi:MAG: RNA polymerase sigma factor, partial [Candidatus Omnitrophica bacterium]|nr:RNA polymerase sigma factor [Candidatus Omnitrophota bacterium]
MGGRVFQVSISDLKRLEESAWSQVYSALKDHVFNLAMRRTGDRDLSLDVVQQTFITAMATIDKFNGDGPLLAGWITGIARNVAYSARRMEESLSSHPDYPRPPILDRAPLPDMTLMMLQDQEVFELALSGLPKHW